MRSVSGQVLRSDSGLRADLAARAELYVHERSQRELRRRGGKVARNRSMLLESRRACASAAGESTPPTERPHSAASGTVMETSVHRGYRVGGATQSYDTRRLQRSALVRPSSAPNVVRYRSATGRAVDHGKTVDRGKMRPKEGWVATSTHSNVIEIPVPCAQDSSLGDVLGKRGSRLRKSRLTLIGEGVSVVDVSGARSGSAS
mmetsp:Transcript_37360/g.79609  ORF Transcript_37360/g.79609 Transcript_37360/m.79609 type:complete len:203 (-) Transcript_37360:11-619(-)